MFSSLKSKIIVPVVGILIMMFILIILYAISSLNVLILAISILPYLPDAFLRPYALAGFNIISVSLMVLLTIYHMVTMFHHRKRYGDHDHLTEQHADQQ